MGEGGLEVLDQNGTCTDSSAHCHRPGAETWEMLAVVVVVGGRLDSSWGSRLLPQEAPHLSPGDPLASCLPILLRVQL